MLKRMKQQIKQETEQERIHMKDRTIRGVIFDQDGLLFDTERLSAEAWDMAGVSFTGIFFMYHSGS